MSNLVSLSDVTKGFGAKNLFSELSLSVHENEKIAIIGKNGSGKSTLLKLIAGVETVDGGTITLRKNLRISYVPQVSEYSENLSVFDEVKSSFNDAGKEDYEIDLEVHKTLSECGFEDITQKTSELSGGWLKRLAIAKALVNDPELLLLDEPTNHMDWSSLDWLERLLSSMRITILLISHDRHFLNQVTSNTIEIGQAFVDEHLTFSVTYDQHLEKKQQYFDEQQKKFESLGNKARRELAWLRAGVKARTTKSRSRIKEAKELFSEVKDIKNRINSSNEKIDIGIDESSRKTKKLIEVKGMSKSFDEKHLFKDLDLLITPKSRIAILGDNGSGKSTFVKIVMGELEPDDGEVKKAHSLKVLYFDQSKAFENEDETIFEYLGEGSEQVVFKDQSLHVASYASKFLFTPDHFFLKIAQLSGGEQARLKLAKILLRPCDVFILDEPTNDLDIESIEALEELLRELKTALLLISHDKRFITQVSHQFLALDGDGGWGVYADVDQWKREKPSNNSKEEIKSKKITKKKSMSYKNKKELDKIEALILKKEEKLEALNVDITHQTEPEKLKSMADELAKLELEIQAKYERWEELERLKAQS